MASDSKEPIEQAKIGMHLGMRLKSDRKVRVVAKVRGFTGLEGGDSTSSCICVNNPSGEGSEAVIISFGDQSLSHKDSYEFDYCYEQNQENDVIFSREVKPLIYGVFDGCNATVIAYGARGSGKTSLIQGSCEKQGIASLAMTEFLQLAEEKGKLVSLSYYEVCQENVYDLLDSKRPAVQVLDNGKGNIQLKGLSQVPVRSMAEFYDLYLSGCGPSKTTQKIPSQPSSSRSHKGLMLHVSSPTSGSLKSDHVGKINFVDLAGYEDARRKSVDNSNLIESNKINKPIYAVLKVVSALNAHEIHVPYRESKLTRMLQDTLGGPNKILMLTCLNPYFCQDSIYMASLVARSCRRTNHTVSDSNKKTKSMTRPFVSSSLKYQIPKSGSTAAKAKSGFKVHLREGKAVNMNSSIKGRKLFDEASHLKKIEKEPTQVATSDRGESTVSIKDIYVTDGPSELTATTTEDVRGLVLLKEDEENKSLPIKFNGRDGKGTPSIDNGMEVSSYVEEEKENMNASIPDDKSPPISVRLQELSNSLKSLCSSTPLCIKISNENDPTSTTIPSPDKTSLPISTQIVEPQTPVTKQCTRVNDGLEISNFNSPWETLSIRSSGVKNSLVDAHLRFFNTASKDELKRLKGIGEKRATYIIERREESPMPFKSLDDLEDIGLSAKQIKGLMIKGAGELFN